MTAARAVANRPLIGSAAPRLAPPRPARSDVAGFRAESERIGITLMPWQEKAAAYLTATGADGDHLYHEVCIVVARQNGKTTLMKPYILRALRAGLRVMHIAQTRELPRHMFGLIGDALSGEPELFPKRRGRTIWPRYGAGQEEIVLVNGGSYRIAASKNGGGRGWTNDIVIIDELREMVDHDIIQVAAPTLTMTNGQMIYLSNAGDDSSVVLNDVRARAGEDPDLAYLEWSAAPERAVGDRRGWAEANPALGHFPAVLQALERSFRSSELSGSMAKFETEHLCRWVATLRELLVPLDAWTAGRVDTLPAQRRAFMGIAMDPSGRRASAALAWRLPDESFAVRGLLEATGDPIDMDALGADLRTLARDNGVVSTGYDPLTAGQLAKYLLRADKITGNRYANATSTFRLAVNSRKLSHLDCESVTEDLAWTAVKPHDESGSFQAVRADDDRPITSALAVINAVELASSPRLMAPKVM